MRRRPTHNDSVRQQDAHNIRLIKLLVSLLLVFGAFAAGFAVRGNDAILARLGIDVASKDSQANPGLTVQGSTYNSLAARVAEVQGILAAESLDSYDLDTATNNVLKSLADTTDDTYLRYYDATHYANYLKEVSATYAGVGILFAEKDGAAYALDVFAGSEAEAAGVQSGDYVVAIDGDRGNDGWSAAETVKNVTRDAGSSVVMTFRHPETSNARGGAEYTVTLQCSNYAEPNVTSELSGSVGYVKLSQITQNADSLVSKAVADLTAQGAQAFVLDLRDNPGGYLTQAIDVASVFVKSGVVVNIQAKEATTARDATGSQVTTAPVVVLVNGNTASTAEVIAGALQDSGRATIVGLPTMGKGSVQSVAELSFGGALRYTSAYYLTPNGYNISGRGITPNVVYGTGDDPAVDLQKNLAIETASSLVAN